MKNYRTQKLLLGLILVLVVIVSCKLDRQINVTVIDKEKNLPIDSAEVVLITIIESRDVFQEIKYTNPQGVCTFSFKQNPLGEYRVSARKKGFWKYLQNDSTNISKSQMRVTDLKENNIELYITSDSMNHVKYWLYKEIRYNIDTLIKVLKTDTYRNLSALGLPTLKWEDIPKLLEITNDSTFIQYFPSPPIASSSLSYSSSYLGVVAMWLIESIRRAEEQNILLFFNKFPSPHPVIHYKNKKGTQNRTPNTLNDMRLASILYKKWWGNVQHLEKEVACKVDPLEDSNFRW